MTGLDTNVLARYLTQDHPTQSATAAREIEQAARSGANLVISPIVLCELVWVLESAYDYGRSEVAGALDRILRTAQFEVLEKDLLWPALEDYRRGPGDFADYYLGRRHHLAGAEHTLTFDQHLKSCRHFRVLIEDRMDVAAARKALAGKSPRIPLAAILRKYGVK